jgi:Family of unknown function (DUF5947)
VSDTVAAGAVLQRLARRAAEAARASIATCDLCGEPVAPEHRHLLESEAGRPSVACACQACALLFSQPAASLGRYRLIPDRYLYLADLVLTDTEWNSLHVPVGICYITGGRAFFPGPMGATDAAMDQLTWASLSSRYPILAAIQPDLEALLVNRARGATEYFVAPIDTCFSLVGIIRVHWRGLSGGEYVWEELSRFFHALRKRSRVYPDSVEVRACQSGTT